MSEMKETEAKRPIMPDAGADNRPLVELTHVEKHYGDLHVLKDINLTAVSYTHLRAHETS